MIFLKNQLKILFLYFLQVLEVVLGAYTIYSIKSNNAAPLAMICQKADLTVATGCALANIPLITINDEEFSSIENGMKISLDTDSPNPIHINKIFFLGISKLYFLNLTLSSR